MENLQQFKPGNLVYDLFGYFLPGFFLLCLIIIDFDLGRIMEFYFKHNHTLKDIEKAGINYKLNYLFNFLTWNTDSEFKFTTLFILIVFCYLIGHVIAAISSLVLETFLNKKILGLPSSNLLNKTSRNWFQKIFMNYTKCFDHGFIDEFERVFILRFGSIAFKRSIYWLCFGELSMQHPVAFNRAMHFLSLYGFSRNVAACFFIYSSGRLLLACCTHLDMTFYNMMINFCYIIIGIVMFKNYLKLYYRQCAEIYYQFYALRTLPT